MLGVATTQDLLSYTQEPIVENALLLVFQPKRLSNRAVDNQDLVVGSAQSLKKTSL